MCRNFNSKADFRENATSLNIINVTKRLKNWKKLCILIQIKSDLLELFYIARYRWII
jgi:hypothetical protein